MRAMSRLACLLLLASSCVAADGAGGPPSLHLDIDSIESVGVSDAGTVLARVFFKVYASEAPQPETLWTRDVDETVFRQLHLDGLPAPFVSPPDRVRSETRPVPMVFLLVIDVSGSMGGYGSWRGMQNYDRRMKPLRDALLGFIANNALPHVYVRLYPFGHLVPHPVEVPRSNQDLEAWQGRYLPLTGDGADALEQGVTDIDGFVRDGHRNVDTSLFAAYREGIRELGEAAALPEYRGAKRVLILLTDGMNDPRQAPQAYRDLTVDDVLATIAAEGSPAVYTIGFGLDDPETIATMENVARLGNADFTPVAEGQDAAAMLHAAYEDVVELEGRSWYVDVDTGKSRKRVAIEGTGISVGDAPPMNDRMLLLPSAGVEISTRYRLIALDLIGLLVAGLLAVWFFFYQRRIDASEREADSAPGGDEAPSGEIETVSLAGMSVQAWRRQQDSGEEVDGDD